MPTTSYTSPTACPPLSPSFIQPTSQSVTAQRVVVRLLQLVVERHGDHGRGRVEGDARARALEQPRRTLPPIHLSQPIQRVAVRPRAVPPSSSFSSSSSYSSPGPTAAAAAAACPARDDDDKSGGGAAVTGAAAGLVAGGLPLLPRCTCRRRRTRSTGLVIHEARVPAPAALFGRARACSWVGEEAVRWGV